MRFCERCGGKLRQDGTCPGCSLMRDSDLEKTLPVNMSESGSWPTGWSGSNPSGSWSTPEPTAEAPAKKKKIGVLITICICAAVLIGGVIYGAILLSGTDKNKDKKETEKKQVDPEVVAEVEACKHDETRSEYACEEFGEHTVTVFCANEECGELISEETEACVDEDDDKACDLCGMMEYEEVLEEDGYRYGVAKDGSGCTILRYDGGEDDVEIPEELGGHKVTTIAAYAFSEADEMMELSIPKNVTVQSYAFSGCDQLDGVWIEENCVLEEMAFADCGSLGDVNVNRGLAIDYEAFYGCDELRGLSYVGENPFVDVDLPKNCIAYEESMDVDIGKLKAVVVVDDIIYGKTYDEEWLVLDLPDDRSSIEVDSQAKWIMADAVDGLDSDTEVKLGEETMFAFEIYDSVDWDIDDNTMTSAWRTSCLLCILVNEEKGREIVRPDAGLAKVAMLAAEEICEDKITDGSLEAKVATKYSNQEGISFSVGDMDAMYYPFSDYESKSETATAAVEEMRDSTAAHVANGNSEHGDYEKIGMHFYVGEEGVVACWVAIIE